LDFYFERSLVFLKLIINRLAEISNRVGFGKTSQNEKEERFGDFHIRLLSTEQKFRVGWDDNKLQI
jgi:hypothetical protein